MGKVPTSQRSNRSPHMVHVVRDERKTALLERHCFYITQPDGDYIDEAARVKIREEVRTTLIGFAEKPKAKRSLGFGGADGAFDGARQPGGCCGCAVQ